MKTEDNQQHNPTRLSSFTTSLSASRPAVPLMVLLSPSALIAELHRLCWRSRCRVAAALSSTSLPHSHTHPSSPTLTSSFNILLCIMTAPPHPPQSFSVITSIAISFGPLYSGKVKWRQFKQIDLRMPLTERREPGRLSEAPCWICCSQHFLILSQKNLNYALLLLPPSHEEQLTHSPYWSGLLRPNTGCSTTGE